MVGFINSRKNLRPAGLSCGETWHCRGRRGYPYIPMKHIPSLTAVVDFHGLPQKKHAEDSSAPCKTASPGDTCYKAPEKSHKNARVFCCQRIVGMDPACFFLDLKNWTIEKISLIRMENDVLFFGLKCRQGVCKFESILLGRPCSVMFVPS